MFLKKINNPPSDNTILIVPLDWGLGHATRCIPIIKELEFQNCQVIIAAEKQLKLLLQHEFQHLTFIPLAGYRISYSKNSHWFVPKLLVQIPQILYRIYQEHKWLKKVVKQYGVNAVIADNRFGLHHSGITCVYITHQLLIKTGNIFTEKILQQFHYRFIKKYTACWVPDFESQTNIAGQLSHPVHLPANVNYIGALSRFEITGHSVNKDLLLILLSGPEPQRTKFETILLQQLQNYKGNIVFVRGLPGSAGKPNWPLLKNEKNNNVAVENHLDALQLNKLMLSADWIVCRSGYTTVMDLIKHKKKAILVPTPGQTEQEYLAAYLQEQQYFFTQPQHNFNLYKALEKAKNFEYVYPVFDMTLYKKKIAQFVQSL